MSGFLLDVNVILALIDPAHEHHAMARGWAARKPDATWLTCPLVQNGVLRVSAQPAYSLSPRTAAAVRRAMEAFCARARHRFCPDDISLLDGGHLAKPEALTPARITDLYLLALARHHGARLATLDRRIPADAVNGGAAAMEVIDA